MEARQHEKGSGASATTVADEAREPKFQDWARFVSFQPPLYFRPRNLEDLKHFLTGLQQGAFKPTGLRVLGGLHSCSEICASDATIDVSGLPKTIEFGADDTQVTVSTNWHLHDFLLALSERGKALSATGGTDEQTLAGLISTNTVPATPRHSLYDLLEWVEYLTIDEGNRSVVEQHVSRSDPAFPAVICSLGAIGILTKAHFRLIDEPYFETVQKIVKLKDVLTNLAHTSQTYEFWRVDWIPDTDEGWLWSATRIQRADRKGDYAVEHAETILKSVYGLLHTLESAGPLLDNAMRVLYGIITRTYGVTRASGPLRNMLPVDWRAPLHVAMAEWSFDPAELASVMQHCREYFHLKGWPNMPIEIELSKTDDYFMSAWNWPGLDYIVKLNFMYLTDISDTASGRAVIMTHLHGLWDHLLHAGVRFKAHWGKINFMDYAFVCEHYRFDEFKPYTRQLFLNKYLTERLSPDR